MAKSTPATLMLDKAAVSYRLHSYVYDPDADSIGLAAAAALGVPAQVMLKTLIVLLDGKPACVVLPSDREVSMKKLAAVLSGKRAEMSKPADAERVTGYHVGGVSPFGQKKRLPTVVEADAMSHAAVFVNGGQRGLQIELAPSDLVAATNATVANVT
jgi:Cys-tRNA(Pro)/Cys-tRNA(Cys) deacylase